MTTLVKTELHTKASKTLEDQVALELELINSELSIAELMKYEIDKWHWYDRQLFNIYKDTELSIRDIAKETTISSSSIFNTIKNCKRKIKSVLEEDYADYKNTDYEFIK